jgi:hypothetical protein
VRIYQALLGAVVFVGAALNLFGDVTSAPVTLSVTQTSPYQFVGLIANADGGASGSGTVVANRRIVVSCAHVPFNSQSLTWSNNNYWARAWHQSNFPALNNTQTLRGYWFFSNYDDLVQSSGSNAPATFAKDVAVYYAYEDLANGYTGFWYDGASVVSSSAAKLIVGYPSGLYAAGNVNTYLMHQSGPFSGGYSFLAGNFCEISGVAAGPGNSGGPVFVTDNLSAGDPDGGRRFAAVHVAGRVVSLGATYNSVGAVAVGAYEWQLANDALISAGQPPIHDSWQAALRISGNSLTFISGNSTATKELGEPNHAGNAGGRSVWWRWVAPNSGTVLLTTVGSNFDTTLAVYTGSAVNALTAIAADDESGGANTSALAFNAVGGAVYWIAVDGWRGTSGFAAAGAITLNLNLAANTAPTISDIANLTVNEDSASAPLPFTVGDAQTAAGSLTVTGSSSNTTLVPNTNIVFGGSGANRTVTVTPAANQSGTTTIAITVSDGTLTASDTFVLTVNAVNDAPTISDISNQTVSEDTATGALSFTVGDVEMAAASLTVGGSSSNTTLVPTANIVFGGSGANRTVTVTPAVNQSGTATITITVSDVALTASDTFVLTVNPVNDAPTISDVANQTINPGGTAGPLAFTVGDIETVAASLTVTGSSSNTTLVPHGNIVFGGTGANRTVTVTPVANQSGVATISVTVSDGIFTAVETFTVEVRAVAFAATHAVVGAGYLPGGTATIVNTFTYSGAFSGLTYRVLLPTGWSLASSVGDGGGTKPAVGTTGSIEWAWSVLPPSPGAFTYTLNVPTVASGEVTISALVLLQAGGSPAQLPVQPEPLVIGYRHSADSDRDNRISVVELTRVIELYNVSNGTTRTGCYAVAVAPGEDGFVAAPTRAGGAAVTLANYHSADTNRDGRLRLVELTRVIELFNTRLGTTRTGAYRVLAGSEDGFAPGP